MISPGAPGNLTIHALPAELIGYVMHLAIKDQREVYNQQSFPSLQFASVCQRWRNIALADHDLWRVIFYDYYRHTSDISALVTEYIRRAGGATLCTIVAASRLPEFDDLEFPAANLAVLLKLAGTSHRWDEAIISVSAETLFTAGAFCDLKLGNLRSLTVINEGGFGMDLLTPESGFQDCPKLIYARLEGHVPPPVVWTTVETLILVWYLPGDIYRSMQRLSNSVRHLQIINILLTSASEFQNSVMEDFSLPDVLTVRFGQEKSTGDDHSDLETLRILFTKANFPNICDISADMQSVEPSPLWPAYTHWPLAEFSDMVGRCSSTLTSLQLRLFTASSSSGITALLRHTPLLATLHLEPDIVHIESTGTTRSLLTALTWDAATAVENVLLPVLTSLHIHIPREAAVEGLTMLLDVLVSRCTGARSSEMLTHVQLVFSRAVVPEAQSGVDDYSPLVFTQIQLNCLRDLVNNGLKFFCQDISLMQ